MADKKVSELDAITGENTAADDLFLIVDTSGAVTKKITRAELNNAIEQDVLENISITNLTSDLSTNGNDINFGDNDKAVFGAGSDLQIYHDTLDSYIVDSGTGDLILQGGNNVFIKDGSGNNMLRTTDGAQVRLYYGNATRLDTTSSGIDITGTLTADGLTVDGEISLISTGNEGISFYDSSTSSSDLRYKLTNDITDNDSLKLFKYDSSGTFNGRVLKIEANGDISFYADDGTTQGLFWDASTQRLGVNTTSPLYELHIEDATGNAVVNIESSTSGYSAVNLGDTNNDDVGQIKYDNSTNSMQFTTDATPRMTITSGGLVGIGSTNPVAPLYVTSSQGNNNAQLINTSASGYGFYSKGGGGAGGLYAARFDNYSGSQLMTLDNSGNLLVGTTDTTPYNNNADSTADNGFAVTNGIFSAARYHAAANTSFVASLNRTGTDGPILQFRKSGTNVGSIGTYNGDFYFGQGAAGIIANDGTPNILPYNVTSGGYSDDAINLGQSNARFQDLYLSGRAYINDGIKLDAGDGIYFGQDGTAANKLDDYEEGTFTPTFDTGYSAVTYNAQLGHYTKVGRTVTIHIYLNVISTTASGNLSITGLPFATADFTPNHNNYVGPCHVQANTGTLQNSGAALVRITDNSSTLFVQTQGTTGVVSMAGSELGNGIVNISITYTTS